MSGPVETTGSIETFCHRADAPASRRSSYSFDDLTVGDRVSLCFNAGEDTRAPYGLKVRSPNGALVLERLLRELPTGMPQSEAPVEFTIMARGRYSVEIRELSGKAWGQATIRID